MPVLHAQDILHGLGREATLVSVTTVAGALSVTSPTLLPQLQYFAAEFDLNVTAAATDVGDTLDVYVDTTMDGAATWLNVVHFTQCLGNGGAKHETAVVNPTASVAVAPVNTAADGASGAVRNLLGSSFRVRYVQVDANANASFAFTVKMRAI